MSHWTVNGRFLTQPTTGVQRYATEILGALMDLNDVSFRSSQPRRDLAVALPSRPEVPGSNEVMKMHRGPVLRSRIGSGHAWEQLVLPHLVEGGLLSLGNTGPVGVREQIVCIHDANVFNQPASYSRSFGLVYRQLLPLLGRRARHVTTVSSAAADQLIKHGIAPASKITVLPNGHEHALRWQPDRSELNLVHRESRPYVLLIGSSARHKNMGLILGLADSLDRIGIDVYITGRSASIFAIQVPQTEQVPQTAESNLKFLGPVSDADLALLLSRALCLAFPSFTEGFGLPIVEAMALGCPVICSNVSSMPEVAGDAALQASPTEPDAWLKHIKELTNDKVRAEFIHRGRDRVQHFSWRVSAAGYQALMS